MGGVPICRLRPSVARRLLSYELRRMVARAGVTHREMGDRLGISRAGFSQMVSGENLPSVAVLEVVTIHLGAAHDLPRLLDLLAAARSGRGVIQSPSDRDLVCGLEAYADLVEVYDAVRVTHLILDDERRAVLTAGDSPEVVWLVEEHVMRRPLSSADRMRVGRVLEMPNVTVQVVPWNATPNPGLTGAFEIVHGPAGVVVCEETRQANLHYDGEAVVSEYREVFAALRRLAHDPDQSRAMVTGSPQRPAAAVARSDQLEA